MELKRAKEVLEKMKGTISLTSEEFKVNYRGHPVYVDAGTHKIAVIVGLYNVDELEAIATWMRDPEGVVKA